MIIIFLLNNSYEKLNEIIWMDIIEQIDVERWFNGLFKNGGRL